jgi:hypothetical protein
MPRPLASGRAVTALAGAVLVTAVSFGVASASPSPRIVARPDSIMVNGTTSLTGKHFPARATLTIEECSAPNWIAPQSPCDSSNAVAVHTNGGGNFKATMKVLTCPPTSAPGFSQICYVGEPKGTGVDTVTLVGAEQITVTGP